MSSVLVHSLRQVMRGGRKRWDDKLASAKTEELERRQIIQVIDEALQQGQDVHTVALACTLTFVGAAMIPAGLFPWEELNETESSSQFISLIDPTLVAQSGTCKLVA